MSNKVYKKIEITGTSEVGLEDAIQGAVAKASKTVRNMRWFEVIETRGALDDGRVTQWQVTLKIGFGLDD